MKLMKMTMIMAICDLLTIMIPTPWYNDDVDDFYDNDDNDNDYC